MDARIAARLRRRGHSAFRLTYDGSKAVPAGTRFLFHFEDEDEPAPCSGSWTPSPLANPSAQRVRVPGPPRRGATIAFLSLARA